MKLSIIIVNYNVKHFLEQCLHSVQSAINDQEIEVFVVDNNSVDGSLDMVKKKFPDVKIIANKYNAGFSKANNQAIREARGEYVLLLNPDTVVENDSFSKIISFMDEHPDAGGLGVKMLDGAGRFLPESKRGLPTPAVAFYKIFGLSRLFPKSKTFGKYHLSYLDKDRVHEVEILSGAFMLMRKKVLDKIGLLDETFFMYGEDIDLSYRIIKAGYKNYYLPETRIIHYKGESTKKSSVNYVFTFYNAMVIFAKKHFSAKNASLFAGLINLAVYFRAFLALFSRVMKKIALPVLDVLLLAAGVIFITNYWQHHIIFPQGGSYPISLVSIAIPAYVLTWLFSVYMSGGYDKPIRLARIFRGILIGTIIILMVYALLPEALRFSRAIILLGALWGITSIGTVRILLHLLGLKNFKIGAKSNKRYIIAGNKTEALRVADLLRKADMNPGFIGLVSLAENEKQSSGFIGNFNQLYDIIHIYKIDEVIFCAKDIPAHLIIDKMAELNVRPLNFKIAPPESLTIIGSQSINTSGDIYIIELDSIARIHNRRNKRFLDILTSLLLLIPSPLLCFVMKNPGGFIRNLIWVLFGKRTWVGYRGVDPNSDLKLPQIKKGILNPTDGLSVKQMDASTINRLNLLYARDYKIVNDIHILMKGFRLMGR